MPPDESLKTLREITHGLSGLTGREVVSDWLFGKKRLELVGVFLECLSLRRPWGILTAASLAVTGSVGAAGASDALAKFERQLQVLDGRAAQQYAHSDRFRPDELETVPAYTGAYRGALLKEARGAARRYNVPEDIFLRLVDQESRWNIGAVSSKGARGLAQLMPDTAKSLKVDPDNPSENLEGGARYLAQQYARFRSWRLALAADNAGPGAVEKYGDVPPFAETQDYVRKILGR